MDFLATTFDVAGKLMIAYTAIKVHFRFWKEHRIDEAVFTAMRKERVVGIAGVTLIIIGYLIETYIHFWL